MYQIPELISIKSLKHAFSTKDDGDMSFNFSPHKKVVKNKIVFFKKADIDIKRCVSMIVTHGDNIAVVGSKEVGRGMLSPNDAFKVDALVTKETGVFLFLKVGDCAPVIIYDSDQKILALVHMGWVNVHIGSIEKLLKHLKSKFKVQHKNLKVFIGPCARKDSFIKNNPSQLKDPKWKDFLEETSQGNFKVDFVGLFKKQIIKMGINKKNVFDCEIDTVRDDRFYSHVRDGCLGKKCQGRFSCVIGMV